MNKKVLKFLLSYSLFSILFVYLFLVIHVCGFFREIYPMNVFSIPYSGDIIWLIVVAIVSYAGITSAHNIYKNVIPWLLKDNDQTPKL